MEIDLNSPIKFTLINLAILIGSKDDSQHRQIRVRANGELFLSDEVGNINTEGLAFRLETFAAGGGHTGKDAANDSTHVQRIYDCLDRNLPNPTNAYIEEF